MPCAYDAWLAPLALPGGECALQKQGTIVATMFPAATARVILTGMTRVIRLQQCVIRRTRVATTLITAQGVCACLSLRLLKTP